MWAFVADGRGSVRLDEVDEPAPGPSDIVIAVEAFSVNRGETFQLEAPRPDWRPGKDIAGHVAVAAADGSGPELGARVVAHVPSSGWAERAVLHSAGAVVELPTRVDVITAAALPLAGLTALRLLRRIGPLPGCSLLITGASGGVGHYVTELAITGGAEVTAVSASPERGKRLADLGARVVAEVEQASGRFDVVLESVGGSCFTAARRKAGTAGRVIWFGQASRQPVTLDFFDWIDGTVGAPIEPFHYQGTPAEDTADLHTLVRLVHQGHLHPEIGLVESWTRTAQVLEDLRARRIRGNAILTVA
jgi:NADPH:quinone reductase-like Zn-dependent oxidoreductase